MVTSRFHKEEAVLQRDTMIGKVRTRRMLAFVIEIVAMLALFILMLIFLGPLSTKPPYIPIYPAIVVPLSFGAAFLATGAYFKRQLYGLGDLSERPAIRTRYSRTGLVYLVISLMVALIVLMALTPFVDTNLAEQSMASGKDKNDVAANTYIRLQFQGADIFGSYRAELSVTSVNNVSLDFYLVEKSEGDRFDPGDPPNHPISSRVNATSFVYDGPDLKAQDYTLVISNLRNDNATINYKVFQRTSDDLSLVLIVFFLVYVGMAGGWVAYVRTLARTETVPVIAPPVPAPVPPRPAMPGPPQPGTGMPGQAMPPSAPGPAPGPGGVPMSITCPRCATVFEVMRGAGPTKIKCPGCGKEGTLAGLPAAALAAARAQQAPPQPAPTMQPAMAREAMPQGAPAGQYAPLQYRPEPPEAPARPEYPPARLAQAGTGSAYPPSAPQAYAQPAPAAGDMYAQPATSPAPAAPLSPYDQLMAMGLGPAEPAIPEVAATPVQAPAPVAPAPAPVPKKTIACPRCKQAFQIDKVEGPQHIRCPHCGKEGTVGAKKPAAPAAAGAGAAPPVGPSMEAPPALQGPAPAPRPAPAPVTPVPMTPAPRAAPAPAAPQRPAPAVPQTPSPAAGAPPAGPKMISCPACKRPFPVTETRRPIQVKCPACGKEGVLRK